MNEPKWLGRLSKGQKYSDSDETLSHAFVGWSDDTRHDGLGVWIYFNDDRTYRGPDHDGLEPLFDLSILEAAAMGRVKSEAKAVAARENAKKGGRPKGKTLEVRVTSSKGRTISARALRSEDGYMETDEINRAVGRAASRLLGRRITALVWNDGAPWRATALDSSDANVAGTVDVRVDGEIPRMPAGMVGCIRF